MIHSSHFLRTVTLMLGIGVGLVACSGEDQSSSSSAGADAGTDAATDAPVATEGSIEGTATYKGASTGPLILSVFTDVEMVPPFKPVGPPAGVGTVNDAMWPGGVAYTVKKLKPGEYYMLAYISVGAPHFMGPQGKDPVGIYSDAMGKPLKIPVKAGEASKADFELIDPPPPPADGGTDGGGGAGGGA